MGGGADWEWGGGITKKKGESRYSPDWSGTRHSVAMEVGNETRKTLRTSQVCVTGTGGEGAGPAFTLHETHPL